MAVLGLGEAGLAIARDLVEGGADVRGFDPRADAGDGVPRVDNASAAAEGADVVLSLNSASAALEAAESVREVLGSGQVFADLNSAGAPLKRELASVVAPTGALFADVALMAGVPGRGVRTPALASGDGAPGFAACMQPYGMPVQVVGDEPGQAAVRKLLRSVFMKGLAAAAIESLAAAEAAGCEDWMRSDIRGVIDPALLERLETGSRKHAARRVHEVEDAAALLRELGLEPRVAEAAAGWLRELRDGG